MSFKIKKTGRGKPIVAIVGCVHGDEKIGKRIIDEIDKVEISKGTVLTISANTKAVKCGKRYCDQDLNRSFPGKDDGNHEERLAYNLKKVLKGCDYVIDIHSTVTDTESLIIMTKFNDSIHRLIKLFNPKRVVLMPKNIAKKSLIHHCKAGISFEYGRDKCEDTYKKILNDISLIFNNLGVVEVVARKNYYKTEYYKALGVVEKKTGYIPNDKIRNFKLVKKGSVVLKKGGELIRADKDFYPMLFGKDAYENIFGFSAEKIRLDDLL